MSQRFEGELNWIDPKFLITEKEENKIESFFLGMAVFYNDLNGLLLLEKLWTNNNERPNDGEVNVHAGCYSGILLQIQKLAVSAISEFFIFLKKNTEVFQVTEFKDVLDQLPKNEKLLWEQIVAAAHGKLTSVENLIRTIVQIRNNMAFHYDHSGKIFRRGFISRFFNKLREDSNKLAYYSIDDSDAKMTRFYFADAAIQECINIMAGKKIKENFREDKNFQNYHFQVGETIKVLNKVTLPLLKYYIKERRNRPHPSV